MEKNKKSIQFEIQLGNGWYLDSNGRLHSDPVPAAPVYELKGGLPFDAKKIEKVFSAISKAMPDEKNKESIKKFKDLGLSDAQIKLLGTIGTIASAISIYLAIVVALIAVAQALGFFGEGPSALEKLVKQVNEELKAYSVSLSKQLRNDKIDAIFSRVSLALAALQSYVSEAQSYKPDPTKLKVRLQHLEEDILPHLYLAAFEATNPISWGHPYNEEEYSWPNLSRYLYTQPEGAPSPIPVTFFPAADLVPDHRIAVPMSLYATSAYLLFIKGIMPEYRTIGRYRKNLRDLATLMSSIATNMRERGLARIIYTAEDFRKALGFKKVPIFPYQIFNAGREDEFKLEVNFNGDPKYMIYFWDYSVGAFDLLTYTDAYLRKPPVTYEEYLAAKKGKASIKRGQLEMLWTPKSTIYHPSTGFLFPEYCAEQANKLSEEAYLELLVSSGYLQLVHQVNLLRHMSTDPDQSETVEGKLTYNSFFQTEEEVTAKSKKFIYAETVFTPARKQNHKFTINANISTQWSNHSDRIKYRIFIRSLRLDESWIHVNEPSYEEAYRTRYIEDEADPQFKKLLVEFNRGLLLDELLLFESESPELVIEKEGELEFKADTFDWYIPQEVKKPAYESKIKVKKQLSELGFNLNTSSSEILSIKQLYVDDGFWGIDGYAYWGERRQVREEKVQLKYKLKWEKDELLIQVEAPAQNRNCALYVVIEENLVASNQFLHTAFPLTMNTQLTFVPQEFYDQEKEGASKDFSILGELTIPPKEWEGEDEIIQRITDGLKPVEFAQQFGLSELLTRYNTQAPDLLKKVLDKYQVIKRQ